MNSINNINPFRGEPESPFIRHENSLRVPEGHDPDCVIVYQHALKYSLYGQHVASIIAGKPGELLFKADRASIDVYCHGPSLSFYDGYFGIGSQKGSMLIPKSPFPALAEKLRGDFRPGDDEERHLSEKVKSGYSNGRRTTYFHTLSDFRGCESLLAVANWDYFEERGMTWNERASFCYKGTGRFFAGELKEMCDSLGLKFGLPNPHQEHLDSLTACFNVIEAEYWLRVQEIASLALQYVAGNTTGEDCVG